MSNDAEEAEIPALGEGYSHARKAYGLVSALLMAWELIGLDLSTSPIESVKLTLKSPQAAPYVLIVLILYFGFRMTIEWYQNDIRRRRLRASRIDFGAAHSIAAAAVLLYSYQTVSKIQVADTITGARFFPFVVGVLVGQVIGLFATSRSRKRFGKDKPVVYVGLVVTPLLLGLLLWALFSGTIPRDYPTLIIVVSGLLLGFGFGGPTNERLSGVFLAILSDKRGNTRDKSKD